MGRRKPAGRRSQLQVTADDALAQLQLRVGAMLLDGRKAKRLRQDQASDLAGISRSEWSNLERGKKPATLWIVNRAAYAVGGRLKVYVEQTSAADLPRDAVHLRHQELLIRIARPGGWRALPEEGLDRDLTRTRFGDVLFERRHAHAPTEYCLCEVLDWISDVGAATRDFTRRLAALDRYAVARMVGDNSVPRTAGCWIVRATRRNRELVREHRGFFHARFPGSGRAWLAALTTNDVPLPKEPALLWVSVDGTRIFAARLG